MKRRGITTFALIAMIVLATITAVLAFKVQANRFNLQESETSKKTYDKYYAMIAGDSKSDFWNDVYEGAKSEGEKSRVYVEQFGNDLGVEYSVQERMDMAIASKVDGIILEGENSRSMQDSIKEAMEKGIPVVTVSSDVPESQRVSYIGNSRYELGQTYGKQINLLSGKIIGEKKKSTGDYATSKINVVVLASAQAENNDLNLLMSGVREEISKNTEALSWINLSAYEIDDKEDFSTEESIRDLFVGQVKVPDILVCLDQIYTISAAQAVVDFNRVGVTNIIGHYGTDSIYNSIKKEIIFSTVSMDAGQMGRYCVDAINEYKEMGYVSEYYAVDSYVVDLSNLSDYWEVEK